MLSQKILKFMVSAEMPFLAFSARYFWQINMQENSVVSCLFYSSLGLSKVHCWGGKKVSDAIRITE